MNASAARRTASATNDQVMTEARGWVQDCVGNPEDVDGAPAEDVVLYVDREYAGGWAGFLADSEVVL